MAKNQPALLWGDIEFIDAPENVLMFRRRYEGQTILAAFNLSADTVTFSLDSRFSVLPMENGGKPLANVNNNELLLLPYASAFLLVE